MTDKLKGIIPAFYTCFDDSGAVSAPRCEVLARHLVNCGVSGLYVAGSSGECIYLSTDERMKTLEAVINAVGGRSTVIAHVAAPSTQDSIKLAIHAQKSGADAIAAIPGLYYSLSDAMVERYWLDILEACDLPLILYNIPQTTGYTLSINLFEKMLATGRVAGIKNSSMSVLDIARFKIAGGENFAVLSGPDEQYLANRVMGADGGIGGTYAVMPELFVVLDKLIVQGLMEQARLLQYDILHIIDRLLASGSLFSAAKAILTHRGIKTGTARLPFLPIKENEKADIMLLNSDLVKLQEKWGCQLQ